MRLINSQGYFLLIILCVLLYGQFWLKGYIPAPFDTLVGAYYPWLDYKWGTITGVPVKNALLSDSFSTFYIWKYLAVDQYLEGKLPVWNPYVFSGTPLLATFHSAVLFPANILLFLPKPWSWGLYIFGSTLTAALAMYLFLGRFTKSLSARLLGATVFSLAGPMTTWTEFGTGVWAMATWPILFLLPTLPKKRYLEFSSIFLAMVLAGNVQIIMYFIPLFLGWSFILKKGFGYLKFLLLGTALAAIQFIPTIDLYQKSIRASEVNPALVNHGLTPVGNMIRFWVSDFFGHPVTGNHWATNVSYHEYSSFMGTITFLFIINFIIFKKNKNNIQKFWIWVFLGSIILLVNSPLSRMLFSLPFPLLKDSSASRLLFVTVFSGSILTALGFQFIKNITKTALFFGGLVIAALFFVPIDYKQIALRNSILPLALIVSVILLKKFWLTGLVVLSMFDLGRYFLKYNPFTPKTYAYPSTPVIRYLQENIGEYRFFRQNTNLLPLNTWTAYKLKSPEGYDALHLVSYQRKFHILNNKSENNAVSRYAELDDVNTEVINELGLKYYLSVDNTYDQKLIKLTDLGWKKVYQDGKVSVYRNPLEPKTINEIVPDEYLFPVIIGAGVSLLGTLLLIIFSQKRVHSN